MDRSKACSEQPGVDRQRLQALLDRPQLARIMQAVRHRLERGGAARVSIDYPTEQERRALDELLGRKPSTGKRLSLPLQQLEDTLQRAGLAPDLHTAIESLGGVLRNLGAEREQRERAWQQVFASARAEADRLGASAWLAALEREGLLKRLAEQDPERAGSLLRQALRVLQSLPQRGKALSTVAADCLGDAHGLDEGQPVATLVKRALCSDAQTLPTDELWANAGVLVGGGITSAVLVTEPACRRGRRNRNHAQGRSRPSRAALPDPAPATERPARLDAKRPPDLDL